MTALNAAALEKDYFAKYETEAAKGNNRLQVRLSSFRASMAGKCARLMFYMMTQPENGVSWHTPKKEMSFADGKRIETDLTLEISKLGYEVKEMQLPIDNHPELKKRGITGHVEFKIHRDNLSSLCEIKSMTGNMEPRIDSFEDLEKYWFYRPYVDQFQLYLYGTDEPAGIYIIKNKDTSVPSFFDVSLDLNRIEKILEKADLINSCLAKNEPPPKQPYCEECAACSFAHVCLNDIKVTGQGLIEVPPDPGVIEALKIKEAFSGQYREYNKANDLIKKWNTAMLGNKDKVTVIMGEDHIFEIKRVSRKEYTVAASSYASGKLIKEKIS